MRHDLYIDASHGQDSSLYTGFCSCGWVSGDGRCEDDVRAEHADHVAGKLPSWQMLAGEDRSWQTGADPATLPPLKRSR